MSHRYLKKNWSRCIQSATMKQDSMFKIHVFIFMGSWYNASMAYAQQVKKHLSSAMFYPHAIQDITLIYIPTHDHETTSICERYKIQHVPTVVFTDARTQCEIPCTRLVGIVSMDLFDTYWRNVISLFHSV